MLPTTGPAPVANVSADEQFAKLAEQLAKISQPPDAIPDARFDCDTTRCATRHPSGRIIVHTADAVVAQNACAYAALIVIDDAEFSCRNPAVAIITKRDLARQGSAAVRFAGSDSQPEIRHAVAEPYRPWHGQRQFSRAARGMPPYQRKSAPAVKRPSELPEEADKPAGKSSQ